MFRLCCTRKVLKRLGTTPSTAGFASTNVLGDWYVDVSDFIDGRAMYLFVNAKTRLPILTDAEANEDVVALLRRSFSDVLSALDFAPEIVSSELSLMERALIVKTNSRSVLGSMNEFWSEADAHWSPGTFHQTSLWLGETLCGPLKYATPIEVLKGTLR